MDIKTCFVIGPIGNELAPPDEEPRKIWERSIEVYEKVIKQACAARDIDPVRADEISEPGEITEQIMLHLRDDDLVIADLTDANPNVMYELALRHSTGKPAIHVGEYKRLPFDISVIRTIQFTPTPTGYVDARKAVERFIDAVIAERAAPVTAARVFADPRGQAPLEQPREPPELDTPTADEHGATIEGAHAGLESDDPLGEPGFLELVIDMQSAMPLMNSSMSAAAEVIHEIGAASEEHAALIRQSDEAGRGMEGRQEIARSLATALDEPATRLEASVRVYEDSLQRVDRGMDSLLARIADDPSDLAEAGDFAPSIHRLADTADDSLGSARSLAKSMEGTAGLSRDLRGPTLRIRDAISRMADSSKTIRGWSNRLRAIESGATGSHIGGPIATSMARPPRAKKPNRKRRRR